MSIEQTVRMLRLLHPPSPPSETSPLSETRVVVNWPDGYSTRVELSDRRTLRCWRRFLALFMNCIPALAMEDADTFCLGVEAVVSQVKMVPLVFH
jgi:hypothetical protein